MQYTQFTECEYMLVNKRDMENYHVCVWQHNQAYQAYHTAISWIKFHILSPSITRIEANFYATLATLHIR